MTHLTDTEITYIYYFFNSKNINVSIDLEQYGNIYISTKDNNTIFHGMQIMFEDGIYEVSQYMAGINENELHVYTKTKSLLNALKSIIKGNKKRKIIDLIK